MMGRQDRDQRQLFYDFNLDDVIPPDHLLRRLNVFAAAALAGVGPGRRSVETDALVRGCFGRLS